MRNWWLKFGCFLIGYNYNIVKSCSEASAKAVKKYLAALLIVSMLWGFIGYSFTLRYLHGNNLESIIGALVMIIIVIQIERQIILVIGKTWWSGIFRIVIGLVMACIGSIIIDQIIFKDDIENEQISNIQDKVNQILPSKTQQLDLQIVALDTVIKFKEKERQAILNEVSRKPLISLPFVKSSFVKDSTNKMVISGKTVQTQAVPNPKTELIPQMQEQINVLRAQKTAKENSKLHIREDLETELKSKTGFLNELTVLFSILLTHRIALIVWCLWFTFLLAIELFVLTSKFGDKKNDYDNIILHQMEMKLVMLGKLK
jgi:hypothetical protein